MDKVPSNLLTTLLLIAILALAVGTHLKVDAIGKHVSELNVRVTLLEQHNAVYNQGFATLKIQAQLMEERLTALERQHEAEARD